MLDVADLMRTDAQGRGIVNVLAADKLMQAPRLYAIFLLWLLGDLYEKLPEVGDMEQPKLVFFFDEAHLLFTDAPQALLTKIEQVVRWSDQRASGCISSPRTRWIFPTRCWVSWATASSTRCAPSRRVTRRPSRRRRRPCVPIPGWISRPPSPNWASARPWCPAGRQGAAAAHRARWIVPPASRIGPATDAERQALRRANPLSGKYEQAIDRESAYEVLAGRASAPAGQNGGGAAARQRAAAPAGEEGGFMQGLNEVLFGSTGPRGGKRDGWSRRWPRAPSARSPGNWREASWDRCLARRGAADVAGGLAEPSYLTMRCHTQ